jgi:copper resistance protein B
VAVVGVLAAGASLPRAAAAQHADHVYSLSVFDIAEYRPASDGSPVSWDLVGWVGGDVTRLWYKSEGDARTTGGEGGVDAQLLYGRLIAPFWDVQVGVRVDGHYGAGDDGARALAVFGLQGLAPYWFEVEPALYVSQRGDIEAQLTASYDMFVTQRLIAQPRLEAHAAVQDVPDFGVGSGLNSTELGFRLRYELRREFAPYLGVNWLQRYAGTARIAEQAGEVTSDFALVGGIRMWF